MELNYNWDLSYANSLKKLCDIYLLLPKNEEEKKKIIYSNKGLSYIINHSTENEEMPLFKFIESERKTLEENSDVINFIKIIKNNLKKEEKIKQYKKLDHSFNDCIDVANDFYKNFDNTFYNVFLEIIKDKNKIFKVSNKESHIILLPYFNTGFINIFNSSSILDFINTIHETMHLIELKLNSSNIINKKGKFIELSTQYIDMMAIDYLKAYSEFESESNIIRDNFLLEIINNSDDLLHKEGIINKIYDSKCDLSTITYNDITNLVLKKDKNDISMRFYVLNLFLQPTDHIIKHCGSFPYSLVLYQIAKEDKDLSKNILKQYILSSEKESNIIRKEMSERLQDDIKNYSLSLRVENERV